MGAFDVDTREGPGRMLVSTAADPRAALILGHGAGGGPGAHDLEVLARRLPSVGVSVYRFEQPWRLAGRRVAVPPARLDIAWLDATTMLRGRLSGALPLYVGGRSAGARVACRTAEAVGAAGVLCLAFPLHLPGRPERSRAAELLAPAVPRLVLQGSRDAFGTAEELRDACIGDLGVAVVELPGADHSFRVAQGADFTAADLREVLVEHAEHFAR